MAKTWRGLLPAGVADNVVFHVGVSGGKDSSAALIWMVRESGIPNELISATFADTGNEHEWTYKHIETLSREVFPIQTIKPERDFFELAAHKKRFPGAKTRFCTQFLKIYPSQEVIGELQKSGSEVIAVSGVRADESEDRSKLEEWDYSGNLLCRSWRPLISWSIKDVYELHLKHGIALNPLYAAGATRVGCFPCIMSRKAEIRMIAQKFPERIDMIREAERDFKEKNGRSATFFPSKVVPERFRSVPYTAKDGVEMMVASIDDVVRWSLTGKRAKGSYLDDEPEPVSCNSGFCE